MCRRDSWSPAGGLSCVVGVSTEAAGCAVPRTCSPGPNSPWNRSGRWSGPDDTGLEHPTGFPLGDNRHDALREGEHRVQTEGRGWSLRGRTLG